MGRRSCLFVISFAFTGLATGATGNRKRILGIFSAVYACIEGEDLR